MHLTKIERVEPETDWTVASQHFDSQLMFFEWAAPALRNVRSGSKLGLAQDTANDLNQTI